MRLGRRRPGPAAGVCANCGTPSPYLKPPGSISVFLDNSPSDMAGLVAALTEPAELPCAACGQPLPVSPTIIGLFCAPDDGQPLRVLQIVVPGTYEPSLEQYEVIARENLYIDWFITPTPQGYNVQELTVTTARSPADPARETLTILSKRSQLAQLMAEDPEASWRYLSGPVLAAAQLAGMTADQVAAIETAVWRQLLRYWNEADIRAMTHLLDTDIGLYVAAPPTTQAVTTLLETAPPDGYFGIYAFHALRAYACLLSGVPNPDAANWAMAYLVHEAAVARHPSWRLFAVSPDRARATISLDDARTAVTGILHESYGGGRLDTDLLESLQASLDALGYGGLLDTVLNVLFEPDHPGDGDEGEAVGDTPPTVREARALLTAGRVRDAIPLLEAAVTSGEPVPDFAVMLLAGAYEDVGAVDRALALVEDLYRRRPGYFEQFEPMFVLAMLRSNNGRPGDGLAALDRAAGFAATPTTRMLVAASRALTFYDLGRRAQALSVLQGIDVAEADRADDNWWGMLRILARLWRNLIVAGEVSPAEHASQLDCIDAELAVLADGAGHNAAAAAGQRAQLLEARGQAATPVYAAADASRRSRGAARDPREVIELARAAYRAGGPVGRAPLDEVAAAIAGAIGELNDPLIAALQLRPLSARLTELAGAVWDYAGADGAVRPWEALLTVGELQRDTLYRIRSAASEVTVDPAPALPDLSLAALSRLARPAGTLAVITWFQLGVGRDGPRFKHIAQPIGMIVTPDAEVGGWLPMAGEIPSRVPHTVERVRSRLANWHDGRVGDPLELPAWQELAAWIRGFLDAAAGGERPHVIFMEYPEMASAPWHTAAGPQWTASYAGSWSEIFEIAGRQPQRPGRNIGVVHVPRFNEPRAIRDALTASVERTLRRYQRGGSVRHRAPEECDRDWLRWLLRDADIVKILCHGYVSPQENEVCLMLAHQGALPLAGSLASGAFGLQHRFSWRDCQDITDSHATIFSAACSSRAAVSTAAGDRLGIFAALRRSGARALVAPAWDVQAGPTAELLDHTLDLYLSGQPLAEAARSAADAAEAAGMKPWIARSLAVEGDWR